jgi:hypothetical protein
MEILVFVALFLGLLGTIALVLVGILASFVLNLAERVKANEYEPVAFNPPEAQPTETGLVDLGQPPNTYDPRFTVN